MLGPGQVRSLGDWENLRSPMAGINAGKSENAYSGEVLGLGALCLILYLTTQRPQGLGIFRDSGGDLRCIERMWRLRARSIGR